MNISFLFKSLWVNIKDICWVCVAIVIFFVYIIPRVLVYFARGYVLVGLPNFRMKKYALKWVEENTTNPIFLVDSFKFVKNKLDDNVEVGQVFDLFLKKSDAIIYKLKYGEYLLNANQN
jgi:hypothetical protein